MPRAGTGGGRQAGEERGGNVCLHDCMLQHAGHRRAGRQAGSRHLCLLWYRIQYVIDRRDAAFMHACNRQEDVHMHVHMEMNMVIICVAEGSAPQAPAYPTEGERRLWQWLGRQVQECTQSADANSVSRLLKPSHKRRCICMHTSMKTYIHAHEQRPVMRRHLRVIHSEPPLESSH
jgi:hypothetical protein